MPAMAVRSLVIVVVGGALLAASPARALGPRDAETLRCIAALDLMHESGVKDPEVEARTRRWLVARLNDKVALGQLGTALIGLRGASLERVFARCGALIEREMPRSRRARRKLAQPRTKVAR